MSLTITPTLADLNIKLMLLRLAILSEIGQVAFDESAALYAPAECDALIMQHIRKEGVQRMAQFGLQPHHVREAVHMMTEKDAACINDLACKMVVNPWCEPEPPADWYDDEPDFYDEPDDLAILFWRVSECVPTSSQEAA